MTQQEESLKELERLKKVTFSKADEFRSILQKLVTCADAYGIPIVAFYCVPAAINEDGEVVMPLTAAGGVPWKDVSPVSETLLRIVAKASHK